MDRHNAKTTLPVLVIALLAGLAHMLTNGQYGFHRDEWQFLSDAQHLDWGFVPYPPLTPAVEALGLKLFGLSLVGLRLFSVLAQMLVIVVAGLMARDLGGGRLAQVLTAVAVALSPVPMFQATEFQYSSFDLLWWVLVAWCVIRLLRDDEPRWWIAIGVVAGLGLQTKYSIAFLLLGVFVGMVLTDARRHLKSGWFWAGGLVALAIIAPNLVWLVRHDFISYRFLQGIHARDVHLGRADGFLRDQFLLNANLMAAPVWLAGLYAFAKSRRYRMLAWMYAVPLLLFLVARGRFYYVSGAYPMLLAMGSVVAESRLRSLRPLPRRGIVALAFAALLGLGGVRGTAHRTHRIERPLTRLRASSQRRSTRGDRLAGAGRTGRRDSRRSATGRAGEPGHRGGQLWRVRRHRVARTGVSPAGTCHDYQFRMAAWLPGTRAIHVYRAGQFAGAC